MPEITDIPIRKEKKYFTKINLDLNFKEDEDDNEITNDTNESNADASFNSNCESEIPFLSQSYKIKKKLIDNAIKSERTMNKIFNNMNPNLQPNKE